MSKRKSVTIILLISLIALLLLINKNNQSYALYDGINYTPEIDTNGLTEEQKAIINTAYAFFYRGKNLQYYSANLTYNDSYGNNGHDYHIIPEDATEDNIMNTDCSAFIYLVFENTFVDNEGNPYKIGDFKKGHTSYYTNLANPNTTSYNATIAKYYTDDPVGAKTNDFNFLDTDTKEEKLAKFINVTHLEPGDIIATRNVDGSSGHAILYLGGDVVINSSQTVNHRYASTYMYDEKHYNYNDWGTVGFISLKNNVTSLTSGEINKYIFSSNIKKLAVISPLKEIKEKGYQISDTANKRKNYRDLVINKVASVKRTQSVNLNDEITYEIRLTNKGNTTYNNIIIEDTIPTYTTYVRCNNSCSYNNGKINWQNISLAASKEKVYSYTVKVNNNTNHLGKDIVNDKTIVNGIKINTIKTKINKSLSKQTQNDIRTIAYQKANQGKTYSNDNIVNIVYKELDSNYNTFENKTAANLMEQYFTISNKCFYPETDVNGDGTCGNYSIANKIKIRSVEKFGDGSKDIYTLKETETQMKIDHLYGGLMTLKEQSSYTDSSNNDDRIIRITENDFMIGDVLILVDDDYESENSQNYDVQEKGIYLYIGNGEFATVNKNGKITILNDKAIEKITIYYMNRGEAIASNRFKYYFDEGPQIKNVLACKTLRFPGESTSIGLSYFDKNGEQITSNIRAAYDQSCNVNHGTTCWVDTTSSNSANYFYNNNGEKVNYSSYEEECMPYYKTDRSRLIDSLNAQNGFIVLRPSYNLTVKNYNINYNLNGGTVDNPTTYTINSEIAIKNPTKEGYTFIGWTGSNGTTPEKNIKIERGTVGSKQYTANWAKNISLSDVLKNNGYRVNGNYIFGFNIGLNIKTLNNKLGSDVTIIPNTSIIASGTTISKGNESYIAVVKGDLNGDGKINSVDLLKMRQHLLKIKTLTGAYKEAGLIATGNTINSTDLLRIRQHLLGQKLIKQ